MNELGKGMDEKEIVSKVESVIKELEALDKEDYWGYTNEYWLGLLNGSKLLLEKIVKDLK